MNDLSAAAKPGLATLAIHAGQESAPVLVYATSTYVQRSPGDQVGLDLLNPLRRGVQ